jgi:hypothetical protein
MYSKGISWIDDVRIPFEDTPNPATNPKYRLQGDYKMPEKGVISEGAVVQFRSSLNEINIQGRFPANILVSDDMLNDGIKPNKGHRAKSKVSGYGEFGGGKNEYHGIGEYMEVDSKSRYYDIDKWFNNLIDV